MMVKVVEVNDITDEHWHQIGTLEQITMLCIVIKSQANFGNRTSATMLAKIMNVISKLKNVETFIFEGKTAFEIDVKFYKEFIGKRSNVTLILKSTDVN